MRAITDALTNVHVVLVGQRVRGGRRRHDDVEMWEVWVCRLAHELIVVYDSIVVVMRSGHKPDANVAGVVVVIDDVDKISKRVLARVPNSIQSESVREAVWV